MSEAVRDQNHVTSMLFVGTDGVTAPAKGDQTTGRLYVDLAGGSGTVTEVSVVTANGFAGTVADETTTPAITITTTVNAPVLAGNGTAIAAATTTGSGSTVVLSNSPTFNDDITLGVAATATGSILFKGLTSGTVTLSVADAAGTWTMKLPANDGDSGQVLGTDGSGNTSWVSAGGVPTTITVADEATDTSCFIGFFTAATGDLGPKTNANLTFNSSTGVATFGQTIVGSISGNAGTASAVAVGGITGLGTGVATALAINVGSAGAFVTFNGALGTPSSGTVTNLTGTASININGTVGATTPTTGVFTTATVNTGLLPDANDGAYLGQAGTAFSDLFLAEGAVINWDSGDATITQTGNVLAIAGADLRVATADVGTNADSVPTLTSASTLTSKRIQPRTASSTTASNLSPDLATANVYYRTTQTATLTIDAPTGTPVIGETIIIYVDSAGAQTLTINATYVAFGAAFPATTTAGKTFMMSAQYNGTNWKTLWANAV